nr:helix-turn-helix transcriptional regulator [Candidatus Vondammii sp. HM_W22]
MKITSDNPAYEPFDLSLETPGEDLAIIGHVIWVSHRLLNDI